MLPRESLEIGEVERMVVPKVLQAPDACPSHRNLEPRAWTCSRQKKNVLGLSSSFSIIPHRPQSLKNLTCAFDASTYRTKSNVKMARLWTRWVKQRSMRVILLGSGSARLPWAQVSRSKRQYMFVSIGKYWYRNMHYVISTKYIDISKSYHIVLCHIKESYCIVVYYNLSCFIVLLYYMMQYDTVCCAMLACVMFRCTMLHYHSVSFFAICCIIVSYHFISLWTTLHIVKYIIMLVCMIWEQ